MDSIRQTSAEEKNHQGPDDEMQENLDNIQLGIASQNAQNLTSLKVRKLNNSALLDKIEVENNQPLLSDIELEENKKRESDTGPDPQKQEPNKGHYETKPSGALLWGFVLCCCVLSAPLGGGFAFLLTPAQFASFGLVVFWKQGKKKVWVVDEKSLPEDKLVTQRDFDKMLTNLEKDDKGAFVPKDNSDIFETLLQKLPEDQREQASKDLSAFSAAIQAMAISNGKTSEEAREITSFLPEMSVDIFKSLNNSNIRETMENFVNAPDDQSKRETAEQLVESLKSVTQEIASESKDFPHKELLTQLMDNDDPNRAKEIANKLADRQNEIKEHVNPLLKLGTPEQASTTLNTESARGPTGLGR